MPHPPRPTPAGELREPRLARRILATAAAFALAGPGAAMPDAGWRIDASQVAIEGTRFVVHDGGGKVVPQEALVGAVLAVADRAGHAAEIRIDGVLADPGDASITLYALALRDAAGDWQPMCTPGPDGMAAGFPVSGEWTAGGQHRPARGSFGLTCTSGAIGKCVRMGYKYWETRADRAPMWDLHQACTRMLRADYCGDGSSYTRDGTLVNVADRFGIQRADPQPSRFEASWAADGAVCVERTRIPELATVGALIRRCPGRFKHGETGRCGLDIASRGRRALISNRS